MFTVSVGVPLDHLSMCIVIHVYCFHCISLHLGALRTVVGEGMPIHRNPFEKGDLFVKFEVSFPANNFTDEKNYKVKITR